MKRHLISFADSRMKGALNRLRNQAIQMNFFDEIHLLTENDLNADFKEQYKTILSPRVRGYGYWLWKPAIIKQYLDKLMPDDELYYVDAGCHFNPNGRKRLLEYADVVRTSSQGVVAFALEKNCSERAFTKMDLMIHLNVQDSSEITDKGQICATHIFCKKSPECTTFIDEWLNICSTLHFIDDSPSEAENFPEFIEHRHDQSVFSILCKLHKIDTLSGNETWPEKGKRHWASMQDYPIWDKRDLGWTCHLFGRLFRKIKKLAKQFFK